METLNKKIIKDTLKNADLSLIGFAENLTIITQAEINYLKYPKNAKNKTQKLKNLIDKNFSQFNKNNFVLNLLKNFYKCDEKNAVIIFKNDLQKIFIKLFNL